MKKFFTLIAVAAMALTASAQTPTVWNFSDWTTEETLTIDANMTKDNLVLKAISDGAFTIDGSKKTIGSISCTKRLKTGGTGGFTEGGEEKRTIKISVSGNSTIKIGVCSGNSKEARTVNIYTKTLTPETVGTPDATVPAVAGDPVEQTYSYVGGPTTITICSANSGVNFYYISATNVVAPTAVEAVAEAKAEKAAPVKVIGKNGIQIGNYNIAGQQVK